MKPTNHCSLMQDAILFNNKAVSQMQCGDYEGAFNILCSAMTSLSCVRQVSVKLPLQECSTSPDEGIIITSAPFNTTNERFYSGSLFFSLPENKRTALPTHRQVEYCTAVCLFNMALACHLGFEACNDAQRRNLFLTQARTLYSTAYEILQKYKIETTDSVVVLIMAICANLVEIELERGNLSHLQFWRRIVIDTCNNANPFIFAGNSVYAFFDSVYVPPGEIITAKAA